MRTKRQWAYYIRKQLERLHRELPSKIEVAFWRRDGACQIEVLDGEIPRQLSPEGRSGLGAKVRELAICPRQLIQGRRSALGWTQAQLAREAGVSRVQLNQIERGRRGISRRNALKLAPILGLSVEKLWVPLPRQDRRREDPLDPV
ncbi:MAG: helix-turn-helix transcriptional regulator [Bdellovibrionales bacterium]|nr:helix-turn-helix transcriptional regulator [Bdellovibrionales bacterium]